MFFVYYYHSLDLSAFATVIFLLANSNFSFLIMFSCNLCSGFGLLFSFICFIRAVACSLFMFCHLGCLAGARGVMGLFMSVSSM